MLKKALCLMVLGLAIITAATAQEFSEVDSASAQLVIQVNGGFNLWATRQGSGATANAPFGLLGSLQFFYSWNPGSIWGGPEMEAAGTEIGFGIEVAYLPMYFGVFNTNGGLSTSSNQTALLFLPLTLQARISIRAAYVQMGAGFAPFIGSIQRLSGTDTLSAQGYFFAKFELGFTIELFPSFNLNIGGAAYIPFTQIMSVTYGSSSIMDNNPLDTVPLQISIRAGITIEI
jgi:hypothetical protein